MAGITNPFNRPMNDDSLMRLIRDVYKRTVLSSDVPNDLKESLRTNERAPLFLRNIQAEINKLPRKYQTADHVTMVTRELTTVFIKTVEKRANEMMMSDAEKYALKEKHAKAAIIDKAATTGIIDEEVMSVLEEN